MHYRAPERHQSMTRSARCNSVGGIANPIAQIWTGAMLLEHLGHAAAAHAIVRAIETVVAYGKTVTRDLGGKASTREVGEALAALI